MHACGGGFGPRHDGVRPSESARAEAQTAAGSLASLWMTTPVEGQADRRRSPIVSMRFSLVGLQAAGGWIIRRECAQLVWREIARWQQKVAHLAGGSPPAQGTGS